MRLLPVLALLACTPTVEDPQSGGTDEPVETEPLADLREPGPARAVTDTGSTDVRDDCTLRWTRYAPDGDEGAVLVVLAHGFARNQAQMVGWAEHLASWGAEVVTPDLCFSGPLNTDHPANGRSLADLATELAGDRPVVLAGHSAGGLAATLGAGELGDRVSGVLLLDPVDNSDLGRDAAGSVSAPIGALFGEPGACNADGNGTAMLDGAVDASLLQLEGADHCHFEDPTDRLCTALCRRGQADDDAIRTTLLALTAGFALWRGGVDARAEALWIPGSEPFEALPATVGRL